jgi:hypothetical protein
MTCHNATILASVVGVVVATATDLRGADKEVSKTVNARDLFTKIKVIGILGEPLGALTTIRGKWHQVNWKDTEWLFRVSHINGKPTTALVDFKREGIRPIYSAGTPATTRGVAWDWKVLHNGKHKPPAVANLKEGEEWEMMGTESGSFVVGLSDQFWDEAAVLMQWRAEFEPHYIFLAVRRIQATK